MCKIFIAGVFAVVLLSAVSLVYGYNMQGVTTPTGASVYSGVPGSLKSRMTEGFGWNVMDENGYNNDKTYDCVDVLLMGGANIEALNMNRGDTVTHKLDELLPDYHVYNVGTSGQLIENCAYYLDNACSYFSPRYVVMDLNSLELDESLMNSVILGTYETPNYNSRFNTLITKSRNYIPVLGTLLDHMAWWAALNDAHEVEEKEEISLYNDSVYMNTLEAFLSYISNIAKKRDTKLIILYHPINYNVDDTGQLIFEDEAYEWEAFEKLCKENDIILVSTKDEYIRMYKEDYVVPNGFCNTRLGSGHINKYGHTAMANVLYETIKDLED